MLLSNLGLGCTSSSYRQLSWAVNRLFTSSNPAAARNTRTAEQRTQDELVQQLVQQGLLSERAAQAMREVDRAPFAAVYAGVPGSVGYRDTPVPISCGQHMDSPSTHARFLALLEPIVQPGAAVLDVGAGSGYMAACLAVLAAPGGSVLALEKHAKLVQQARASITASRPQLLQQGLLQVKACNVMAGPPELEGSARFDAIHLGASVPAVPQHILDLLKPGGRLVLPLGSMHGSDPQVLVAVDKAADGRVSTTEHGTIANRIAPLTQVADDQV